MIQQIAVVRAYWRSLRMMARLMEIEREGRAETVVQYNERRDAIYEHETLERQYLDSLT